MTFTATETRSLKLETQEWSVRVQTDPPTILVEVNPKTVLSKDQAAELSQALAKAVDWIDRGFPTKAE